MICDRLAALLGIDCVALTQDGAVAFIETPFAFEGGEQLPVFVQTLNGQVRFFDDGEVMMHFRGRGVRLEDGRRQRFIRTAGEQFGVSLSDAGDFEIWAREDEARDAFAKYIGALMTLTRWERDQQGLSEDLALFVDEVELHLRAWRPDAAISPAPEFVGVTGQTYRLDLSFDGQGVVATSPHPAALAAAVKKLLDIRSAPRNEGLKLLAVIDDRIDPEEAKRDSLVLGVVADVLAFNTLVELSRGSSHRH